MSSGAPVPAIRYIYLAAGVVGGGVAGYFIFTWALRNGMVPMALPGAFLGIGTGFVRGPRSIWIPVALGIGGLLWGAFCYWKLLIGAPYPFSTFLMNPQDLPLLHLGLIVLGALVAFWVPFRKRVR